MKSFIYIPLLLLIGLLGCSCGNRQTNGDTPGEQSETHNDSPKSSPDSLYEFVARQVAFGPRTPGSEAHRQCGDYIIKQLETYGIDTIIEQNASATIFTGERKPIRNILGQINPQAKNRILLLAHYDTRPWADEEELPENQTKPIDGANDGASGVAVLLELARHLGPKPSPSATEQSGRLLEAQASSSHPRVAKELGIDLLFVDLEDSGESGADREDSWCLGSQYWVEHLPYTPENLPRFGILLDMVGGHNATFPREYISQALAREAVDKIWSTAATNGLADRFPNTIGGSIIDDHLYLNRAGIPCVDIIESANPITGSFNPTWHTLSDNLQSIDRQTLSSVANLLLILLSAAPQ